MKNDFSNLNYPTNRTLNQANSKKPIFFQTIANLKIKNHDAIFHEKKIFALKNTEQLKFPMTYMKLPKQTHVNPPVIWKIYCTKKYLFRKIMLLFV